MVIHYRCYQVRRALPPAKGWTVCRLDPALRAGDPARVVVVRANCATTADARAQAQLIANEDGPLGWVLQGIG